MGILIGCFITIIVSLTIINLLSAMDGQISFLRRFIIYKGFLKKYGESLGESGFTIKAHKHDNWYKTNYDDYQIYIMFVNKKERRTEVFGVFVDTYGNLSNEEDAKKLSAIITKNKI